MTALTLVRNETLKTTRRPAFWVSAIAFLAILSITTLERQSGDGPRLGFPGVWAELIGEVGPVAPFFATILVILLVTGEFSFRTARQNVIDGLSKNAWFAGKLLLVPAVSAAFIALLLAVGGAAATFGSVDGAIARAGDLAVVGGYAAGMMLLVSGGFMAGMLVRGSGSAMAAFFFYITLLERLIVLGIGRWSVEARPALRFAPFNLFTKLMDPQQFDPSIVASAAADAAAANQPFQAPELIDPALLLGAAGLWTALFVTVAYVVYRRRDL